MPEARRIVGPLTVAILKKTWKIRLRMSDFHDLEEVEDGMLSGRHSPTRTGGLSVAEVAGHYRRMEHLAARFDDKLDSRIAVALSDAWTERRIKEELHVAQSRIKRVANQLRLWMAEPREDDEDEGEY